MLKKVIGNMRSRLLEFKHAHCRAVTKCHKVCFVLKNKFNSIFQKTFLKKGFIRLEVQVFQIHLGKHKKERKGLFFKRLYRFLAHHPNKQTRLSSM